MGAGIYYEIKTTEDGTIIVCNFLFIFIFQNELIFILLFNQLLTLNYSKFVLLFLSTKIMQKEGEMKRIIDLLSKSNDISKCITIAKDILNVLIYGLKFYLTKLFLQLKFLFIIHYFRD